MSMILNWKGKLHVDNSLEKINAYEYEPHQGTRLNDVGDITIINEDQFIHPSDSFLYFEGELAAKNKDGKYLKNETGIGFIRNALMYRFKHIEYSICLNRISIFYRRL